ncbi:hypothetical protein RclHR1_11850004 [Rhizophagus clarus]|uniref:Uncharacterized protein n=1 Tax=Rhizophagus clarus TaxID=94130 RepID=A0A2Z6QHQ0_9GLOM|nr:hypothetical protein RclHR1_11850004 [Rhizophagus clarus]GES76446.1 hypothetical protein RCL_jg26321.t1 [Rhizophagus clarus]
MASSFDLPIEQRSDTRNSTRRPLAIFGLGPDEFLTSTLNRHFSGYGKIDLVRRKSLDTKETTTPNNIYRDEVMVCSYETIDVIFSDEWESHLLKYCDQLHIKRKICGKRFCMVYIITVGSHFVDETIKNRRTSCRQYGYFS